MRKLIVLIFAMTATAIILAVYKWHTGTTNYWPLPYSFNPSTYPNKEIQAPILIIGDRMGEHLEKFSKILAAKVSEGLTTPIKVHSIATKQEGLHRTIQRIRSMPKLPLIIIYFGGSEEYLERKYGEQDMKSLLANIELFKDVRIQSLLMFEPRLSRLLYRNMDQTQFDKKINLDKNNYSDGQILKRNEIDYYLYQFELSQLFNYIKDRNAFLFSITAPVNLEVEPKKSCEGSLDQAGRSKLDQVLRLYNEGDYKGAYRISRELSLIAGSSAEVLYHHGRVSKKLGQYTEAINAFELAASFDCKRWRATPVHNAIIKKVALDEDVVVYDFNQMLYDNWTSNITFQDEIYPQNFFMEQMVTTLAGQIKRLLKL